MWHPCSTVTMGNPDNSDTCVDVNFRVLGIKGLRVVDMSVAPFCRGEFCGGGGGAGGKYE